VVPGRGESVVYNLSVAQAHTFFVAGEGGDGVWVHNACPRAPASRAADGGGTIYVRTNVKTGAEYVGQAKPGRFGARQAEHTKANPGESYTFDVLEDVKPGSGRSLDVAEEDWIRAGGGPGTLENSRYQMSEEAYRAAGGTVNK